MEPRRRCWISWSFGYKWLWAAPCVKTSGSSTRTGITLNPWVISPTCGYTSCPIHNSQESCLFLVCVYVSVWIYICYVCAVSVMASRRFQIACSDITGSRLTWMLETELRSSAKQKYFKLIPISSLLFAQQLEEFVTAKCKGISTFRTLPWLPFNWRKVTMPKVALWGWHEVAHRRHIYYFPWYTPASVLFFDYTNLLKTFCLDFFRDQPLCDQIFSSQSGFS